MKTKEVVLEAERDYLIKWMGHGSYTPTWVDRMVILFPIYSYSVVWLLVMMDILHQMWMYLGAGLVTIYVSLLMLKSVGVKEIFNNHGGIGGIIFIIGIGVGIAFLSMGLK